MNLKQVSFLPISPFGRAENVFFHSRDALAGQDLTLAEMLAIGQERSPEELVFPSHLLDRSDADQLLQEIPAFFKKVSLLVSLGAESGLHQEKLLTAQRLGWGLDLVIDRPLAPSNNEWRTFAGLEKVRWLILPLHFFDPVLILQSIQKLGLAWPIRLSFLAPREHGQLLNEPDEIIFWLDQLNLKREQLPAFELVQLRSLHCSGKDFYDAPTVENFEKQFLVLGQYQEMRHLFLQANQLLKLMQGLFMWKLWRPQNVKAMGSRVYWKSKAFVSELSWRVPLMIRWIYWKSPAFFSWLRWQVMPTVFWPLIKFYWFSKFQIEKRIRRQRSTSGPHK